MQLCRPAPDGSGGVARSIARVHRICRTTAVRGRRVVWAGRRPNAHHHHHHHPGPDPQERDHPGEDGEPLELLFANLSTAIAAVEAAHSQFRLAHASRDPDAVRSAARVICSDCSQLSHINLLERSYRKRVAGAGARRRAGLEAQVREQRDRLKTLHLDMKRLQYELRDRDEEVAGLRAALSAAESRNANLETELCLPDLDASYFLSALRYALAAVRRFVELMARHMVLSLWHLDAAAGTLQPDVLCAGVRPEHGSLAFVSLVCRGMFAGFHRPDFGIPRAPVPPDRRRAFAEFLALKRATAREVLGGVAGEEDGRLFGEFCRGRYLGLVEAEMEISFFDNLEQREMVASGGRFPESEFFEGFLEMARRVWILHRLAEAFGDEGRRPSIFQVRRGRRFSEAYMEEVGGDAEGEEEWGGATRRRAVGFMVVPGFKVGEAVIRSKVVLARN